MLQYFIGIMNSRFYSCIFLFILLTIPVFSAEQKSVPPKVNLVKVQIRLDRLGFSCGQIDGGWGSNARNAMTAFQQVHDLETTGEPDSKTIDILTSLDTASTYIQYLISSTDVSGPFIGTLPKKMMEQAQLDSLSYTTVMDELGEKFHCAPYILKSLNPQSQFTTNEIIKVPNIVLKPWIVSKDTTNPYEGIKLEIFTKKCSMNVVDSTGRIIFHAPITPGGTKSPPPYGEWTVNKIAWNPTYYYNPKLFWDADTTDTKAIIHAGPRNPVGVVWINLTIKNYGIHGTPSPAMIGHAVSHGCVRMTNWDVTRVAHMVKPGATPVIIKQE
jgi:lipoprotein-anchoring transpeptidase ErfK/SrfK